MTSKITYSELRNHAQKLGLDVLGVTKARANALESSRLKIWQEKGFAADMNYMRRDSQLQSDPLRLLPEAKSIISFAIAYDNRLAPEFSVGFGKVARYAWGKDYHLVLPAKLTELVKALKADYGDFACRVFADAVPFLERAFGASAGLGFIGKNTLLIRPKVGSFTLLAEILCDLEVSGFEKDVIRSSCGTCRNCLDNCPTGAFDSEYVLNARKCISYLSIEKKGVLELHERKMLGEWIFGCDVCQEVCPFNHGSLKAETEPAFEEFSPSFGVGPLLNLGDVLKIKDQSEFKKRFKDSPILRSKREGLLRNAICVAVNTNAEELLPQLEVLAKEDASPLLRQFGLWGLVSLSVNNTGTVTSTQRKNLEQALSDSSEQVVKEALQLLDCV